MLDIIHDRQKPENYEIRGVDIVSPLRFADGKDRYRLAGEIRNGR